jgi:hypothetical protein
MTESVLKRKLYPQTSMDKSNLSYWTSLHNNLQYILSIHKEQGNKTAIFPFDLAYLITNRWNSEEKDSYKIVCDIDDFETEESTNLLIENNLHKLKETREKIHNKLQYLLDIHVDISKPFPLDLVYMMDLDTYYFFEALEYDKEYNYDRKFSFPYYNGPVFYMTGPLNGKKLLNQYKFFDVEDTYLEKDYLKYYIKSEFITDSVSENYLLWKSADKDNIYDYNRKYIESYYNPDIYLPDYGLELEIENYEYDGINDDDEPRYTSFNHFIDNKTYDDFYTVA